MLRMNVTTPTLVGERHGPFLSLLSLGFVGLIWTLPFLQPYHRYPIPSFYEEWFALVFGLAALTLLVTPRAWHEARLPIIVIAPLGLAGVILLHAAIDRVTYYGQALTAASYLVWAVALIMLGSVLRRELGAAAITVVLSWCALTGGELSVLVALLQHYQISTFLDPVIVREVVGGVHGNVAQPNHFANYIALALASLAYLHASGRLQGAVAITAGAPLIFVLGISGSRSAWLYLGGAFALAVLLQRRFTDPVRKRLLVGTGLMLIAFPVAQWLAALGWLSPPGEVTTVTERLFTDARGISGRLQLWREAGWMFLQAPILGVGWGQFAWNHFEYHSQFGADEAFKPAHNAHNIVLHLLAETGIVGVSLVAGGVLLWLKGMMRATLDLEHWWLLTLLAVIGIHSLLEYPLWYSYFLGMAAFALGVGSTTFVEFKPGRIGSVVVVLMMAAGLTYAISLWHKFLAFDERILQARGAAGAVEHVQQVMPRLARDLVLEPYAKLIISFGIAIDRDRLSAKLDVNGRTMRFIPFSATVYRQALLLALAGDHDAAQRQFSRAARVYPAQLPSMTTTLRELAARYPAEFSLLLESAAVETERLRATPAAK